jgi:hypothetical protein
MTEERKRYRILLEDEKYSLDLRTYNDRETAEHHAKLYEQITGGKTSVFEEVYYYDY